MKVNDTDLVRCPWCSDDTEAKDWDAETYDACITREMRRAFKSIKEPQIWGKNSKHYYICPKCKMWSRGNQLSLIDSKGTPVNNMGGQPVIRTIKGNRP